MATVGFDFGNLTCLIARAGRGGVDVLLNGGSNRQVRNLILLAVALDFFLSLSLECDGRLSPRKAAIHGR